MDVRTADAVVHGTETFTKAPNFPAGTLKTSQWSTDPSDALASSKQKATLAFGYDQVGGTDVVSETRQLYTAKYAGQLQSVRVRPETAPTGGDKQFTVDVQKASDASGAWSTLLNAVVTVDSSSVDNTIQDAVLAATPTFSAGDTIRVVVTASGSTGSQGQGVVVSLRAEEDPA